MKMRRGREGVEGAQRCLLASRWVWSYLQGHPTGIYQVLFWTREVWELAQQE